MATSTEICNLALGHLAVGKEISNLETDQTPQAIACRRFYETALKKTLRSFAWPFATVYEPLALVEENPTEEWDYSYRYPTNCLFLRRVLSGTRNDTRQSRIPYKVGKDSQGRLIYTDKDEAEIEYTQYTEDNTLYPDDFVLALSFCIAMYVAPSVTGGDPFKLGERAEQMFRVAISEAMGTSFGEEQSEEEPLSEFTRARE
jgi:hypothetical protein